MIPALAGEMNRCRHVVAAQARAFAERGWSVLQIDLMGTGDSSGDFGDATWEAWLEDIDAAMSWLPQRAHENLWLWGMRGGCLLAADWSRKRKAALPLLLWQPVRQGNQHLQQFLRMRLASGFLGKRGTPESSAELRERLSREGSLEIAGYHFSLKLASGLESADLTHISPGTRVLWIEIGAQEQAGVGPASQACIDRLRSASCEVHASTANGTAFWQIVEREECPALIDETLRLMEPWL